MPVATRKLERKAIYVRDRGTCHLCGEFVPVREFTLDHLIPLSKSGPDTPENVAVAHRLCNIVRGNRDLPLVVEANRDMDGVA